jgi:peptidyl-dipeptidase Dcp
MAWHTLTEIPAESAVEFEQKVLAPYGVMPAVEGAAFSTSFSHIFSGGYSAGYYSYKWAEVLEADAFSFFKEKGIFNTEVSGSFRENILSKGGTEDAAVLYRNFRGHDPQPEALMQKLGLIK